LSTPSLFYKLYSDLAARTDLPASAKVLLSVITDRMGKNGHCWPGMRRLAADTGAGVATIARDTRRLAAAGLLIVERRDKRRTSLYRLPAEGVLKTEHPKGVLKTEQGVPKWARKCAQNGAQPDRLKNQTKKDCAAAPPNPEVAVFIDWFSEAFKKRLGRAFIVGGGKDGNLVKSMLGKLGDGGLEKLKGAASRMLSDDWGGSRADIGLLASRLNQWLGDAPGPKRGGRHTPATAAGDYDDAVKHFDAPAPGAPERTGKDSQP
jgi:hypothetical protein